MLYILGKSTALQPLNSGHVIAWKAIMTVEAAGLREAGTETCKTINLVCLALSIVTLKLLHKAVTS